MLLYFLTIKIRILNVKIFTVIKVINYISLYIFRDNEFMGIYEAAKYIVYLELKENTYNIRFFSTLEFNYKIVDVSIRNNLIILLFNNN